MPAFKGDATQVRQTNLQRMTSCKSIMIFYGEGEEAWKRSVDTELKKLPAYLDGRSMPPVYTYLAAPYTCDKEDMVDMEEPGMVNGLDGLNEAGLDEIYSASPTLQNMT